MCDGEDGIVSGSPLKHISGSGSSAFPDLFGGNRDQQVADLAADAGDCSDTVLAAETCGVSRLVMDPQRTFRIFRFRIFPVFSKDDYEFVSRSDFRAGLNLRLSQQNVWSGDQRVSVRESADPNSAVPLSDLVDSDMFEYEFDGLSLNSDAESLYSDPDFQLREVGESLGDR